MKHGKKYRAALAKLELNKRYSLTEAAKLLKETSTTKFDSSIEIHLNLGIDTTQAEQMIRSTVSLPHGTGKNVRVVAFVSDDKVKEAKAAGAIEAGSDELIEKVEKGWLDFDTAVATPDMMKNLAKVARQLGQAGLMPNPKSGTVTPDIGAKVAEVMKGQVEFRNDKLANLHNVVGKSSFSEKQLEENIGAYLKAVHEKKPSSVKGTFINSITVCASMGPAIKLQVNETLSAL
ncbi:50S ribosomal protein L1 [Candidatus Peregrinibacteria bacterium RIFCSPLOWO2_02_FULL_48_14]|nr:MAG: 50S ribosomal protein L1 [Candidatus Peregrinibacteria bacterium RIFCSPLOWO2_02_FULL_48_14]